MENRRLNIVRFGVFFGFFFRIVCVSSSLCYISVFPPHGDLQEIYYISTLSPCDKQIHPRLPSRAATFLLCLINVACCFTRAATGSTPTRRPTVPAERILRHRNRKYSADMVETVYYVVYILFREIWSSRPSPPPAFFLPFSIYLERMTEQLVTKE